MKINLHRSDFTMSAAAVREFVLARKLALPNVPRYPISQISNYLRTVGLACVCTGPEPEQRISDLFDLADTVDYQQRYTSLLQLAPYADTGSNLIYCEVDDRLNFHRFRFANKRLYTTRGVCRLQFDHCQEVTE